MYQYALAFCEWLFNGASTDVISFFAVVLTIGAMILALLPICLIVKYVFKR